MSTREVPIVFDCDGDALVGMVHVPDAIATRGLVIMVAGGPQYRGGVGRLQVQLARDLAAQGIPVMRFDHRGLGDSEGRFRDFEDVEADLAAAIRAFRAEVPAMREVVLWGGCNAASAIMINACKYPEVTGIVVSNPWVHTEEAGDAAVVKHHFSKRMREADFWLKVIRLQYNPLPAAGVLLRSAGRRLLGGGVPGAAASDTPVVDDPSQPFIPRMRRGLSRFKGDMLLLMSGRSMVSKEFDDLLSRSPLWQQAMRTPRHVSRHDMPNADQTHSSIASRQELVAVATAWMKNPRADLSGLAVHDPSPVAVSD